MLHRDVIEKKTGFRTLEGTELDTVSGGNIVVIGQRIGDINAFLTAHGDGAGGLGSGSNPFAGAGQIQALTPEQLAALDELFNPNEEQDEEVEPDPDPSPVDPNIDPPVTGSDPLPPGVSQEGSPTSINVVTIDGVTFFIDVYGNPIDPRGFGGGVTIPF